MQAIYNIAEICARKNVREFVLSPGSRCAPLTISMVRHPDIHTRAISDERSAAFIALGIAQQTKQTVGLICTSGSAAYNYAPAVAEAFFQQLPLLILTADRPPEWIDQLDGQTIRQNDIYGKHVKGSYTLPVDHNHPDSKWHIERIINEAINLAGEFPQGPVHVNVPLREPFYPEKEIAFDKNVKIITPYSKHITVASGDLEKLSNEFEKFSNVLIVAGQQDYSNSLNELSNKLADAKPSVAIVADVISNVRGKKIIQNHDIILSGKNEKTLQDLSPDLLITFGKSVISKSLKSYLRKYSPKKHWHIQTSGYVADTFQSLTDIIPMDPEAFINHLLSGKNSSGSAYQNSWISQEVIALKSKNSFFEKETGFTEFFVIHELLNHLPSNAILHLANSMPVRYVNYLSPKDDSCRWEVYANRGTSGIDGVISTAFGAALHTGKMVTVLTGDMSFFYDRNAWWNNYKTPNLRVIILNNHGGGIFRMIDGPSKQPELGEYFETYQALNAENTSKDFGLAYIRCQSSAELKNGLKNFFENSSGPKILEIETDSKTNTEYFKKFKTYVCS